MTQVTCITEKMSYMKVIYKSSLNQLPKLLFHRHMLYFLWKLIIDWLVNINGFRIMTMAKLFSFLI